MSRHFNLREFLRSQTATRHGIDMTAPAGVVENLRWLATSVLDPIREELDSPIIVTSGYRPVALNKLIGGAQNSAHIAGLAVDCYASGKTLERLLIAVLEVAQSIPLAKCINEFGQWLHIQAEPEGGKPRRQFLSAHRIDGKTVYRGLV